MSVTFSIEKPPQVAVPRAAPGGAALTLEAIRHRFGPMVAVDDVTLEIEAGRLVALLGPSGCGKTTLLRIIAGFLRQEAGRVVVGGQPIDHLAPNKRGVGLVFQNYALFPHMSVAENVAYGLKARGVAKAEIARIVAAKLGLIQLAHLADRFPKQLSGGQQQRVALARALAVDPKILLLDEPFGALDKNLRLDMQIEIKRLQRQLDITAILVTHDQEEAMSMADRIAVLNKGRLEQFASPTEVYAKPASLFVNSFVGTANLLPGRVVSRDAGGAAIELDAGGLVALAAPPAERVVITVRPEALRLVAPAGAALRGEVRVVMPLGPTTVLEVALADGSAVKVTDTRRRGAMPAPGDLVGLTFDPADLCIFPHST